MKSYIRKYVGLLMFATTAAAAEPYARPDLLIDPAALSAKLKEFRVLDCRSAESYAAGHIPGAIRVDHADWFRRTRTEESFEDAQLWSGLIGDLGIEAGTAVVVVDDADQKDAARIWWVLRYWSVGDVKLLDGGWAAWKKAGFKTDTGAVEPSPKRFQASARKHTRATAAGLLDGLAGKTACVLDVRSDAEVEKGHVPGSDHLEWTRVFDADKKFKPAGELKTMFDKAGLKSDRATAVHCQSGGRAAVMAFTLELMGFSKVSNYYGSWADWSADAKNPVEKGKK